MNTSKFLQNKYLLITFTTIFYIIFNGSFASLEDDVKSRFDQYNQCNDIHAAKKCTMKFLDNCLKDDKASCIMLLTPAEENCTKDQNGVSCLIASMITLKLEDHMKSYYYLKLACEYKEQNACELLEGKKD
jgi:hypothetical protein